MSLALRAGERSDLDGLAALWVEVWSQTYPTIDFEARRAWFRARLVDFMEERVAVIVAEERGELLGLVTIDPITGWLDQMAVRAQARGTGVASVLMAEAKRVGPSRITLDVNADNLRAIRFYEREGFRLVDWRLNAEDKRILVMRHQRA